LLRVVSCYDARRDRQPRDPPSENGITPTTSHPSNHGFRRVWYDWRAYVHDDAPTLLLPQPTRPRDVTSPDTTRPDQTQKPARAPAADQTTSSDDAAAAAAARGTPMDTRRFAVVGPIECNDPSAGSPTETLLRLLLPLNARV